MLLWMLLWNQFRLWRWRSYWRVNLLENRSAESLEWLKFWRQNDLKTKCKKDSDDLRSSEDYDVKIKCWRSEDRFLMDKLWRCWRLEDSEEQDKVSTHASPISIWSLWSQKTNVTVSKEVHSTKILYPTSSSPRFKLWKRTHVAVLSYPWVTLIFRSQIISNGYIFKGLYKKIKCTDQVEQNMPI